MNYEMCMAITKLLEEIRDEIHSQNFINAERNNVLEYMMPCDVNPSCDLLPFTRKYLNDNAKGVTNE